MKLLLVTALPLFLSLNAFATQTRDTFQNQSGFLHAALGNGFKNKTKECEVFVAYSGPLVWVKMTGVFYPSGTANPTEQTVQYAIDNGDEKAVGWTKENDTLTRDALPGTTWLNKSLKVANNHNDRRSLVLIFDKANKVRSVQMIYKTQYNEMGKTGTLSCNP